MLIANKEKKSAISSFQVNLDLDVTKRRNIRISGLVYK